MSDHTVAVLNAASAVEQEADALLRQAMFSNPAAIAWAEELFEAGLSPEGDGLSRPYGREMAQVRDDRCDCWPGLADPAACADTRASAMEALGRHMLVPRPSVIPSEHARWISQWYTQAHRAGGADARRAARRAARRRRAAQLAAEAAAEAAAS